MVPGIWGAMLRELVEASVEFWQVYYIHTYKYVLLLTAYLVDPAIRHKVTRQHETAGRLSLTMRQKSCGKGPLSALSS